MVKVFAFDCFGTVFDMETVSRESIKSYVDHVRSNDFSPFQFPADWFELKAHPDAVDWIRDLQRCGHHVIAASNGSVELLQRVSEANGIDWDKIVDFVAAKVYKPNPLAYAEIVRISGVPATSITMVTANPTFGDVEGAAHVGMRSLVLRRR